MTIPHRALIIIDAQQEYFLGRLPIQHPDREQSIDRIRDAIDAAEDAGIPTVIVQHERDADAPVFAVGTRTHQNHPSIATYERSAAKRIVKRFASVFAGTDLDAWLRAHGVDTIVLAGYMTNNCVLASAADAEPRGFAVEVLSDATGSIDLANEAGVVSARRLHESLMTLLHSNWAAVTDTVSWSAALRSGASLQKSNLIASAAQGRVSA